MTHLNNKDNRPTILFFCSLSALPILFLVLAFTRNKETESLKDRYEDYFPIGVAVRPSDLSGETAKLIQAQFNSITAENAMKMGPIHPEENRYFWRDADAIVDFASRHDMKVRGHTLCWHTNSRLAFPGCFR
nr:endo-1,4-beta-xylanase [Olivibacter sp. XZL3]